MRKRMSWRLGACLAAAIAGLTTLTAWLMIRQPNINVDPA